MRQRCIIKTLIIQSLLCCFSFLMFVDLSPILKAEEDSSLFLPTTKNAGFGTIDSGKSVCKSAMKLFKNMSELHLEIDRQIEFHQRGGNLISIEKYLNDQMQSTLDRLELEFVPNEAGPVLPSIQYLQQYYKTHKVKRGGYGQPLPGTWRGRGSREGKKIDNLLFEKRWIEPLEPATSVRLLFYWFLLRRRKHASFNISPRPPARQGSIHCIDWSSWTNMPKHNLFWKWNGR